jgi:hypothetical protein
MTTASQNTPRDQIECAGVLRAPAKLELRQLQLYMSY